MSYAGGHIISAWSTCMFGSLWPEYEINSIGRFLFLERGEQAAACVARTDSEWGGGG